MVGPGGPGGVIQICTQTLDKPVDKLLMEGASAYGAVIGIGMVRNRSAHQYIATPPARPYPTSS